MNKFFASLFCVLFLQIATAQTSIKYWIVFKDKNGSQFSINNPHEFLSEKSILRRQKQNISITISDLPVSANYVYSVKALGADIMYKSKWFNAVLINVADTSKIKLIEALPFVKEVTKIVSTVDSKASSKFNPENNSFVIPNQNYRSSSSINSINYGASYLQNSMIGANCLHDLGFQGQGMTIAEFDDGFYKVDVLPLFDSIRNNNQILGGYNFVAGDLDVYQDNDVSLAHGLNTFSCIAANMPGTFVGTCPKAKFWLFVTEDFYSESWQEEINWALAAEFADSVGVDVINSSLGYALNMTNSAQDHSYSDMDGKTTIVSKAAVQAARVGMFVTSSAGNSGGAPWYKITAPADADSILTVGAVLADSSIASFSSRGPTFDGRLKPTTCAQGVQCVVANPNGGIYTQSGTSFSSPITAGAVACLWQAHPAKNNMELLQAIIESGSQFSAPDTIKGYGIPNFCTANTLLTGIKEVAENIVNINVYPNPFNNNFSIYFHSNSKQIVVVEMYDLIGNKIYSEEKNVMNNSENTFIINPKTVLSKGIYILHLLTKEKNYSLKIIKE